MKPLPIIVIAASTLWCIATMNRWWSAKPASIEGDMGRGQYAMARFIKQNYDPDNTLLVLGDGVAHNDLSYWFANRPYQWCYISKIRLWQQYPGRVLLLTSFATQFSASKQPNFQYWYCKRLIRSATEGDKVQ